MPKKRNDAKGISIHPELARFDDLPGSAYVAQPVVQGLFGWSSATLWRRVKDGTLPQPRKLSPGCTRWLVAELRRALTKD